MQTDSPSKPRHYTPRLAPEEKQATIDAVLQHVADGLSLTEIERLPGMPKRQTLNSWIATNKHGLAERYAQAREVRADRIADEIFAIADGCATDPPAEVQKARLQVDARKWYLAKLMPEKYGDSQQIQLNSRIIATRPPSIEEIAATRKKILEMLAEGEELGKKIDEAIKDDV